MCADLVLEAVVSAEVDEQLPCLEKGIAGEVRLIGKQEAADGARAADTREPIAKGAAVDLDWDTELELDGSVPLLSGGKVEGIAQVEAIGGGADNVFEQSGRLSVDAEQSGANGVFHGE